MKTLTFNFPDNIELNDHEIEMLVASRLYESRKLSLGQAAEIAGLSKRAFAELLHKYNVSLFNYPASDLKKDAENA